MRAYSYFLWLFLGSVLNGCAMACEHYGHTGLGFLVIGIAGCCLVIAGMQLRPDWSHEPD